MDKKANANDEDYYVNSVLVRSRIIIFSDYIQNNFLMLLGGRNIEKRPIENRRMGGYVPNICIGAFKMSFRQAN